MRGSRWARRSSTQVPGPRAGLAPVRPPPCSFVTCSWAPDPSQGLLPQACSDPRALSCAAARLLQSTPGSQTSERRDGPFRRIVAYFGRDAKDRALHAGGAYSLSKASRLHCNLHVARCGHARCPSSSAMECTRFCPGHWTSWTCTHLTHAYASRPADPRLRQRRSPWLSAVAAVRETRLKGPGLALTGAEKRVISDVLSGSACSAQCTGSAAV